MPRPLAGPTEEPAAPRRPLVVRAVLSLLVLVGATLAVLTSSPTLGLDLRGGTQVVLETHDSPTTQADAAATDRALEVLRRRIDALGVAEPTVVRSGERRIIVELPGLQDPRAAVEAIGRTAQLTVHAVEGIAAEAPEHPEGEPIDPSEPLVLPDEQGVPLQLAAAALTGEGISGARAATDPRLGPAWFVEIDFAAAGQDAWEEVTGAAACMAEGDPRRRVAIALDGEVITSPQVGRDVACGAGIIGGRTTITGSFSNEEARELAALIQGGALPVPVEVIEQRTVGPSLGAAAIDASVQAIVIGIIATALFIIAVYRFMGLLAIVALVCYALISYASLITLGATITLPGLAGFVLSVGMAVDANVLIYERSREERILAGRSLPRSVTEGFKQAFSAIADSNVTTLISAGLLFFLASGPVRGFGVTLSIGVLVSFFSALVITRVLAQATASSRLLARFPRLSGLDTLGAFRRRVTGWNPDFLVRAGRPLAVALAVVAVAAAGLFVRGVELGVEFTGGRSLQFETQTELSADDAREAVAEAGFPGAVVQLAGDADISVRTEPIDDAEVEDIRAALAGLAGDATVVNDELIGPSLGDELQRNAVIALLVALAAQLAYLAIRFHWTFSSGAVASLATNVLVVLGVFAWLEKTLDGVFLAALLTIIGYSVNDSVVVFDRIRETWRTRHDEPLHRLAGEAVLQTLPRTVNTGASTLFVLLALLFLGGSSLGDFALALVLGIVVGTIGTVVVAVPLTILLQRRWPTAAPTPPEKKPLRPRAGDRTDGAVV